MSKYKIMIAVCEPIQKNISFEIESDDISLKNPVIRDYVEACFNHLNEEKYYVEKYYVQQNN